MFTFLANDPNKDICQSQQEEEDDDGVKSCSLEHPRLQQEEPDVLSDGDVEVGGKAIQQPSKDTKNEESLSCPVCFDPLIMDDVGKKAIQLQPCGHTFCRDCLADYCEYHVSMHRVPVPCPMMEKDNNSDDPSFVEIRTSLSSLSAHSGCPEYLSPSLVEQVLQDGSTPEHSVPPKEPDSSSLWSKYQRLQRLSSDPSLVACTRCEEVVPAESSTSSRTCPACQHVFCALHGDAHLGRHCQQNDTSNDSAADLPRDVKECSHCRVPIVKFAGCDHVICSQCQNDMCFKCGTHVVRQSHVGEGQCSIFLRILNTCVIWYLCSRDL